MISNKEFISQTKENLTKMGSAKAPQFNPYFISFRKLLGIKEDGMVPLSSTCAIPCAQVPDKKDSMTVIIQLMYGRNQSHLNIEVS